jgi:putative ABC transport system permease protein
MNRMTGIRRLLRLTLNRAGVERAVDDELRFHFEMTMRELMKQGMTPDDARSETERRFGNVERTRQRLATIDRARVDHERRAEWWSAFAQDLRYALRGLRLKPGFAFAIVATLGLGIGANATMFGIIDRLLFRAPNFLIAPDRTSRIYLARTRDNEENINSYIGYRRFLDLKENTTSVDAMVPFYTNSVPIGVGDATKIVQIASSEPDLWKMFDVKPVIGRFFSAEDNVPEAPTNVVVLSNWYWQTEFGGRRTAVGRKLNIGSKVYTVIGVAPDGFQGFATQPVIGFAPIAAVAEGMGPPRLKWYDTYNMTWFEAFARRKPGVSVEAANTDLTRAHQISYRKQLALRPGNTPIELARPRAIAGPVLRERGPKAGSESKVATWLGGVAMIVLLIACANVANLLLARALKRQREVAVRIALGVSRGRLLMQLATESMVLAVIGGAFGLVIAQWGGAFVRRAILDQTTAASTMTDFRTLSFVAMLAAVAGLLTGLAPAFQAKRGDIAAALKAGAREGTVRRSRLRVALLILQAAMSVVLLVGAGLFVRSLLNVKNLRLGYDVENLVYVDINWRGIKVDSIGQIAMRQRMLERAKTLPGVMNAARALTVPFAMTESQTLFVAGIDSTDRLGEITLQTGSPEIFETMGTRIIRGRGITREDVANAPYVMVVNELMAKRLWPNQDAIGKCARVEADTFPCRTVVGIAENVRRGSLSEPEMHFYMPVEQYNPKGSILFVRTARPGIESVEAVRRGLQPLLPGLAYVKATAMSEILAPNLRSWKLGATMFAIFGGLALVLAAVGLYSVIAYNVTQRTHEMGVRVALGAQSRDVIRLIVREALTIVLPGVALGAIVAVVASKWLKPLLFEVSPKDPMVFGGVIATLMVVAIAASWAPATRAARIDPNEALRAD